MRSSSKQRGWIRLLAMRACGTVLIASCGLALADSSTTKPIVATGGQLPLATNVVRPTLDEPRIMPYGSFALWQPSFFDADFRYLDKPDNKQHDYWDCAKRIHVGDNWLFSTGGQAWFRSMNEVDSRLGTVDNSYGQVRTRIYG